MLINGASGGVGTYAVQIAKSFGAEVTGVCSTRNVELVRSLGADHVIDYTRENFTEGTERYDLILDNAGNRRAVFDMADVMKPDGIIVGGRRLEEGSDDRADQGHGVERRSSAPFIEPEAWQFFIANVNPADLELLAALAREGKMKSVIDRRYPLEETGAALEYIGSGMREARSLSPSTDNLRRRSFAADSLGCGRTLQTCIRRGHARGHFRGRRPDRTRRGGRLPAARHRASSCISIRCARCDACRCPGGARRISGARCCCAPSTATR